MASKYYGDLIFSTREYEDKDGNKKKAWSKAGAVFKDDETGRMSIKFEAMPFGLDWSGWMSISPKRDNQDERPLKQHEVLKQARDVAITEIDDGPIDLTEIPF